MTKARRQHLRELVYAKCSGHCGYCGLAIVPREMQMDHVHPRVAGGLDHIDNLLPSCRKCNNYKLFFTLEQFRKMIATQVELLRRNSMNFRTAERFGLVQALPREIVFYFERPSSSG
jgi:5-methylcytosine-specific restriction endonuclease McrA